MKFSRIILVISLFSLLIDASCQTKASKLVLEAKLKGSYYLNQNDTCDYFLVEVSLMNNTDSVCMFMAYNCFTSLNVIVDRQVNVCPNHCASNYPIPFNIKPNQTFTVPIILQVGRKSTVLNNPIKIGFVLIQPMVIDGSSFRDELFNKRKNLENVLWSEPINLKIAGGQPYKIY